MILNYVTIMHTMDPSKDSLHEAKKQLVSKFGFGPSIRTCRDWVHLHAFLKDNGYVLQFKPDILR